MQFSGMRINIFTIFFSIYFGGIIQFSIQFNSILFVFISHIIQKWSFTMIIKFINMLSMRDVDAIKNA